MSIRKSKEQFISEAVEIHGDKYDYSKVQYKNAHVKVKIICKKCNKPFEMRADNHLQGQGCKHCVRELKAKKQIKSQEQLISDSIKVHGDKYDYSNVQYKNARIKVKIICKKCNKPFEIFPNNYLRGRGCKHCVRDLEAKKRTKSQEQFISEAVEIHGDKYDYSKVQYKNNRTKVKIICKKCNNPFEMSADNHLRGAGCSFCKSSKGERQIINHLESLGFEKNKDFIHQFRATKDRLDFVLPKYRLLIEYNGEQHYIPISFGSNKKNAANINLEINIKRDNYKIQRSLKNNLSLLIIPYWDKKRIPEIIDNVLAGLEPTFSEPPQEVKKHQNKRNKIRKKNNIKNEEILCGLICGKSIYAIC